jgi:hypothetical protein
MAVDTLESLGGAVGLTVPPPPQEELPATAEAVDTGPSPRPEAPLPAYQGTVVDESA